MSLSSHNPAYPQHFFPQAWSAQDLADAVPLKLFEAFDFDAAQLPDAPVAASNAAAAPLSRDWRRQEYLRGDAMPTFVRVR